MTVHRFSERVPISPRTIAMEQLERFLSTVSSDVQPEHGVTLSADVENAKIRVNSIDELVTHERIPDDLWNLTIRVWEPRQYSNVHQISKSVYLSLDSLGTAVSVEGIDETWAVGMAQRLRQFFDQSRPFKDVFVPILRGRVARSLILGAWFVLSVKVVTALPLGYALLFSVSSAYLMLRYLLWSIIPYTRGSKVRIRQQARAIFGMNRREFIELILLGAMFIISLAQFIVTVLE